MRDIMPSGISTKSAQAGERVSLHTGGHVLHAYAGEDIPAGKMCYVSVTPDTKRTFAYVYPPRRMTWWGLIKAIFQRR